MDEKVKEVLEEEELIKRIADLPDIESMRRVIQTIEDKEKRERVIDRVAKILEEREREKQKLRPIDRRAIVEAKSYKLSAIGLVVAVALIAIIEFIRTGEFGLLVFGLLVVGTLGFIAWVVKKWSDYVVKGY
ncbi:MAG: hypothetical protein ACK42C_00225 [Aquificaceae bacterium]